MQKIKHLGPEIVARVATVATRDFVTEYFGQSDWLGTNDDMAVLSL
jgi:hypothetical protein